MRKGTSCLKNGGSNWYVADFETTSYETYLQTGRTWVWLWAICDSDGNMRGHGDSIENFMGFLKDYHGSIVYFHNLKFDGSFILSWLLSNGYRQIKVEEKLKVSMPKCFSLLIDGKGAWYQIKVNLHRRCTITFQDSLKLVPLKVKQIAKVFNLPIEKEIIDYQDYAITAKSLEYIEHDVKIPAMALRFFKEQGYDKMTIGSSAYDSYSKSNGFMAKTFPMLNRKWCQEWREAYRGGRAQVNPLWAGKVVHGVRRYDINSMYPYVLSRYPMPCGYPIKIMRKGLFRFELYELDISFKLKKGHLPTLLKSHGLRFTTDTYYTETDGIERIYVSSPDYELLKRHYDILYEKEIELWGFSCDDRIFRSWVDRQYKLKQESEGGLRMVYKLIINNLYGKFGSNARGCEKVVHLGHDGIVKFEDSDMQDLRIYYLPVAIAVTSFAHVLIDDAILKTGYGNFIYCDTDSVHTLGVLPDEWVDPKEIGKFKLEAVEETAKYIQQKRYIEKDDGKWHITCAGMNDGLKDYLIGNYGDNVIDRFRIGLRLDPMTTSVDNFGNEEPPIPRECAKLLPKQVKGGCVLCPVSFEMK